MADDDWAAAVEDQEKHSLTGQVCLDERKHVRKTRISNPKYLHMYVTLIKCMCLKYQHFCSFLLISVVLI